MAATLQKHLNSSSERRCARQLSVVAASLQRSDDRCVLSSALAARATAQRDDLHVPPKGVISPSMYKSALDVLSLLGSKNGRCNRRWDELACLRVVACRDGTGGGGVEPVGGWRACTNRTALHCARIPEKRKRVEAKRGRRRRERAS